MLYDKNICCPIVLLVGWGSRLNLSKICQTECQEIKIIVSVCVSACGNRGDKI